MVYIRPLPLWSIKCHRVDVLILFASVYLWDFILEVTEKEHKRDLSVSTQVHSTGIFCSPGQEIFRNSARNFWSIGEASMRLSAACSGNE